MEHRRGADRIRGIDEDDVEGLPHLVDEDIAVGDDELGPGVAEDRFQPGKVLSAGFDDLAVDLDQPRFLDRVFDDLAQRPAIPAAAPRQSSRSSRSGATGGSCQTVKRFISPLRKEAEIEATFRFETPPGRQGQADWGQCWTIIAGKRVKVNLFVLTLGYSRRMYAVATADEKMPAFLRSHEEAFEFLGGVAHEIVYDNLKSVVLGRDFEGSRFEWNPVFRDFSGITASGRRLIGRTGPRPRARWNRGSSMSSAS